MQNYTCNNCAHHFSQNDSTNLSCPACGSTYTTELKSSRVRNFFSDKVLVISFASLLLMLIVLFLLPSLPSTVYDVSVVQSGNSFEIIIKEKGKIIADTSKFEYSWNSGETWHPKATITFNQPTGINVLVKLLPQKILPGNQKDTLAKYTQSNKDISFEYHNTERVLYPDKPAISNLKECDCKGLRITEPKFTKYKGKFYINIESQPECPKQFSINGSPYQDTKYFLFYGEKVIDISVRSKNCVPVVYASRHYVFPSGNNLPDNNRISKEKLTQLLNDYISLGEEEADEKIKQQKTLEGYFKDDQVQVLVSQTQKSIKLRKYFQHLNSNLDHEKTRISVTGIEYDKSDKITQLTVTEAQR